MNPWIGAVIAIAAGIIVGLITSRLVAAVLAKSKIGALRDSAPALAGLVLSAFVVIGLLVALGFVASDELEQLGDDTIAFLPKAISALIIVIAANVASTFAAAAVASSLAGTGAAARFAPMITKWAILGGGAIIAAGQTEVDTAVVNIGVAALLFGVALSLALLTGLGGRQVAAEVAAGRATRRMLRVGDRIEFGGDDDVDAGAHVAGVVADLHPTAVEVLVDGRSLLVPNTRLLGCRLLHERPEAADAAGELDR
ncbi:MAG: hypothetical protein AAFP84_11130 [Actinomycetota bacterium]